MKSLAIIFSLLLLSLIVLGACTSNTNNTAGSTQQNKASSVATPIDNEINGINADSANLNNSDLDSLDDDLAAIDSV